MSIKSTTANIDKIEEIKKRVLEEKLKNPTKSQREIAKDIGLTKSTVGRHMKFLGQDGAILENSTMNAIKDADLEIVTLAQSEILRRFQEPEEIKKVPMREVSGTAKDSQTRYSFLQGENAKRDGGEKEKLYDFISDNSRGLDAKSEDKE